MYMIKHSMIGGILGIALALSPVASAEDSRIHGLWRLVSLQGQAVQGGLLIGLLGERPRGYMLVSENGRFELWAARAETELPLSVWEDAAAAYGEPQPWLRVIYGSGNYSVKEEKIVVRARYTVQDKASGSNVMELAWREWRDGDEDVLSFRLGRDEFGEHQLILETSPIPDPAGIGAAVVGRLIWERAAEREYAPN